MVPGSVAPERNGPNRMFLGMLGFATRTHGFQRTRACSASTDPMGAPRRVLGQRVLTSKRADGVGDAFGEVS
jgi:hypothetical protein